MKWLLMMGGRMKLKPILLLMLLLSGSLSFVPLPVHAATNASGLVGHWAFLEGSGTTVADLSGNGNTGTLTNSPTWQSGANCKFVSCLSFASSNDQYVSLGNVLLPLGSSARTICTWFYLTGSALSTTYTLFDYGTTALNQRFGIFVFINSGGTAFLRFSDGANFDLQTVTSNVWHQDCVTYIAGGTSITNYLDGSGQSQSVSVENTVYTYANIAKYDSNSCCDFQGRIADARLYNVALTSTQITNLYNNGIYTLTATNAAWNGIQVLCDISCSSVGFNTQGGGSTGAYPFLTFNTEYTGTEAVYIPPNMMNSGVLTSIAGVSNNNVANTASYTVGVSGYKFTASTGILIETGASTHEIDFQPGPNCNFCATGISINGQTTTTANPGGTGPPPLLGGGIAVALALGAGVYIFMRRRGSEG